MFVGLLVAIVFVEQGQRRIPVQFAKRQVGPQDVRRPEHLHPAQGQRQPA
jgi:preprotein translocase subunit SecY